MSEPVRVLELRSVWGTGGGPDKTILLSAALSDPRRYQVTVCYIRDARDPAFGIEARARALPIDYVEVTERHSFDPGIFPQLRRLVRDRRIDIVHSHDYKTDVATWLLGKFEAFVPLSTAHGWSGETRKDRAYYDLNKRVLTRFPRVIAVSDRIRDELLRYGCRPDRLVVIPNGIDAEEFRRQAGTAGCIRDELGLASDAAVVGSIGRLETVKWYDGLIDAFAFVRQQWPSAVLVLVGEGPQRPALEQRITAHALGGAVRLLGQRRDVRDVAQSFDVFVQSSRSEGSPNAVLEAMALEVPIVATDVGGTATLIEHRVHGLLVPFGHPQALAEGVLDCLRHRVEASRRAESARRRVERELSFAARNARVERVYDAILADRMPSRR